MFVVNPVRMKNDMLEFQARLKDADNRDLNPALNFAEDSVRSYAIALESMYTILRVSSPPITDC